jgi:N-acetylglucosaminyldiphosphoundecaprenol N-acetyl-beta-D-mannosaminyltransferase
MDLAVMVPSDDLSREVYCVLGIPIDAIEMPEVIRSIQVAASRKTPFIISTPNLNFLISSRSDPEFRRSLLNSDLCPPDGISIVWIARLLGIPIKSRTAGSDFFDALKTKHDSASSLKVFFFGGAEGVADAARCALNADSNGLHCVGSLYPGFGTVDEMSAPEIIDEINRSGADLLVAALGAWKGQLWLLRNHRRLTVTVRAHLGAVLNFQAGTVGRAPRIVRKMGLEWLWRIKEEPLLWRRYWSDGTALLRLLVTHVLPLAFCNFSRSLGPSGRTKLAVQLAERDGFTIVVLQGAAVGRDVAPIAAALRSAVNRQKGIIIDLSNTDHVDARILGLFLMLSKSLNGTGATVTLKGLSPSLTRSFRLNGLGFLV